MDIELLRTFLEVHRTRHFGRAAENLFITQSAVSARIRLLEELLGVRVFSRERNNIRLTPAGQKLLRYAESVVATWNRARQEIAVADDAKTMLSIGTTPAAWEVGVGRWIARLYRDLPDTVLSVEVHDAETLVRRLLDHSLDVGIAFEPPPLAGLLRVEVRRVRLVMVASRRGLAVCEALRDGYVLVDWGGADAPAAQPDDAAAPTIRFNLGPMAREFLLEFGGAAYLAEPAVAADLRQRRLYPVRHAPALSRTLTAVYAPDHERRATIERALRLLALPPRRAPRSDRR